MSGPLKKAWISVVNARVALIAANWRLYRLEILPTVAFGIVGVCLFLVWLALSGPLRGVNRGFGPDWNCSDPGKGALVCIKNPPKN